MKKKATYGLLFTLLFLIAGSLCAQQQTPIVYKEINGISLDMDICYPAKFDESQRYPALVFFHGGGWKTGDKEQFGQQASYFAEKGMISFLVSYRLSSLHQTKPFESLKDAKSAIRYIRKHADSLGVDPEKIVATGISAGGQLAAGTALLSAYNEATDDLEISCRPNALVLYNPLLDIGPGAYGYGRIEKRYQSFSPLHNIKEGAPPTKILLGTEDRYLTVATAQLYQKFMEEIGSRCDLHLFKGEKHGLFYDNHGDLYDELLTSTENFLRELDFIQ